MESTPKEIPKTNVLSKLFEQRERRDTIVALLFIAPFFVLYTIFNLIPIVQGFWISLHNWEILGTNIRFVGTRNYERILQDRIFWNSLEHTLLFVVLAGPGLIIVGLIVALLLNQPYRGMGIFRTAFYTPNVLSVAVIGIVFQGVFASSSSGFTNAVLGVFGIEPIKFLTDPTIAMPIVAATTLWWTVGFNMLIFLAGLQDIPTALYDAAKVDGANPIQLFRHITLPGLRRPIIFVTVLQMIASFQVFGQIDVLTHGGPAGATRTIMYYMYQRAFESWQLGYGSTIAFILFAILFTVSIAQLKLFSDEEDAF